MTAQCISRLHPSINSVYDADFRQLYSHAVCHITSFLMLHSTNYHHIIIRSSVFRAFAERNGDTHISICTFHNKLDGVCGLNMKRALCSLQSTQNGKIVLHADANGILQSSLNICNVRLVSLKLADNGQKCQHQNKNHQIVIAEKDHIKLEFNISRTQFPDCRKKK